MRGPLLKVRVIPTLLWKGLGLVKGVCFDSWRRVGTAMPAVKVYNSRDVDELVLVDILATNESRDMDYSAIAELAAECFVPFTVGGGVNSLEKIQKLLRAGADKVTINSAAFAQPGLIKEAAECFGSQCVVVSIDAKPLPDGTYRCFSHCGQRSTDIEPVEWARRMEDLGAGEILLTSIDRDGTMKGYDTPLIRRVADAVRIPVIAAGGAGNFDHMYEAIIEGRASAVAAASMFHFTELTPAQAKQSLAEKGIPVRGWMNPKGVSQRFSTA
jgi:imidazole glycerol-phosphate synthase subunit HisF